MRKIKLTVIVVVKKDLNGLIQTVDSLLKCSSMAFEVIIKDACADAESCKYNSSDPRVSYYSKSDTGIYDAMNQAVQYASGRYVLFMNCGDCISSLRGFQLFLNMLSDSDSDIVVCSGISVSSPTRVKSVPAIISDFYLYRQVICHQATCIDLNYFVKQQGFDTKNYVVRADQEMFIRLRKNGAKIRIFDVNFIICAPFGFSISPSRLEQSKNELNMIRKKYFGPCQRRLYWLAHNLTFPAVRSYLLSKNKHFALK